MGRKIPPGLVKRGKTWHVEKRILGRRLRESTGTDSLSEAERYLNRRIEEIREAAIYGIRPKRSFREAAAKFLMENQHKRSIADDAGRLKVLVQYIGSLSLDTIHIGTMQDLLMDDVKKGLKREPLTMAYRLFDVF